MKRLFPFLLTLPFFSLCACNHAPGSAHVIILAGQSNMVGWSYTGYLRARTSEDEFNELNNPSSNVKIIYKNWSLTSDVPTNFNSNFSKIKCGQGWYTDRFGPEVGIANVLSKTKEKYFLIKYAMNSSSCAISWNKDDDFYKSFKKYVKESLKKLSSYKLTIDGFFWMQGEQDSLDLDNSNNYGINFTNMITDFRSSFPEANFDIIDAGISNSPDWEYYQAINDAKASLDATLENHHYFSTIDLGLEYDKEPIGLPDLWHYDSLSTIKLGQAFANNYLSLRKVHHIVVS